MKLRGRWWPSWNIAVEVEGNFGYCQKLNFKLLICVQLLGSKPFQSF